MTRSRLRLLGSFLVAAALAVVAALAMGGGSAIGAYVGSGLLCCTLPLAALSLWRALQRPRGVGYELGPAAPVVQMLHLGTWAGIATGSAIWTLAAVNLDFDAKAGFWAMGPLGVAVGGLMAAMMLWSWAHPFPTVRADTTGISVGGGLVMPWRDLRGVRFRRSATGFSHVEIALRSGETLRPKVPLTVGIEDLEGFFGVVGRHLPPSETPHLAQALQ